jgi:hypothetical protein
VSYQALRHFADSLGAVVHDADLHWSGGLDVPPKARPLHEDAANMIFREDDNG